MSAANRLAAITSAVAARDAAPPPEPVTAERTAAVRVGCDLPPEDNYEWKRWLLDTAQSTGRGQLSQQEALYWVIKALQDPVVSRHVRGLIVSGKTAPSVQHKRGGGESGGPEVRRSGSTEVRT
jgi:hypothetical protein